MGQHVNMRQLNNSMPTLFSKEHGHSHLGFGNIHCIQCNVHLKAHRDILTHFIYEEGEPFQSGHYLWAI